MATYIEPGIELDETEDDVPAITKGPLDKALEYGKSVISDIGKGTERFLESSYDAGIGLGQGLTADHMDEIVGALRAVPNLVTGDAKDAYRKYQQEAETEYDLAKERSPVSYTGAYLGAGIVPAVLTSGTSLAPTVVKSAGNLAKLLNIGKAAGSTALLGAAQGHGISKGSMVGTEEEKQKLIDDTLTNTLLGGIFGAGTKTMGEYAMPVLSKGNTAFWKLLEDKAETSPWARNILTARNMAKKGMDLGDVEGLQKARTLTEKPIETLHSNVENTRSVLGKNLELTAAEHKGTFELGKEFKPVLDNVDEVLRMNDQVKNSIKNTEFQTTIIKELNDGLIAIDQQINDGLLGSQAAIDKARDDLKQKILTTPRSALDLHYIKTDLNRAFNKIKPAELTTPSITHLDTVNTAKNIVSSKLSAIPEYKQANDLLKEFHEKVTNPINLGRRVSTPTDYLEARTISNDPVKRRGAIEDIIRQSERIGMAGVPSKNKANLLYESLREGEDTLSGGFLERLEKMKQGLKQRLPQDQLPKQIDNLLPTSVEKIKSSIQEPARESAAFEIMEGYRPTEARHTVTDAIGGFKAPTGLGTIAKGVNRFVGGSGVFDTISGKKIGKATDFLLTAGKGQLTKVANEAETLYPRLAKVLKTGIENPDQLWRSKAAFIIGTTPQYKNFVEEIATRQPEEDYSITPEEIVQ